MFVSEMRETRCRYGGAMSEISGHVKPLLLSEHREQAATIWIQEKVCKLRRILEFITFYQNAPHEAECIVFNHNA